MSSLTRCLLLVLTAWLPVGCAATPSVGPSESGVWGYLRLIPHESVNPNQASAYSDRRLAGVELVDYSHPSFAVVYTDGPERDSAPLLLTIEASAGSIAIDPPMAAHRAGALVQVENATGTSHTLSCPQVGRVALIAPGTRIEFPLGDGAHDFYLLDRSDVHSQVFAAPGDFAVVSSSGRYEIGGLAPGPRWIRAWHPRFPPIAARTELGAGTVERIDLEMRASRGAR